MYVCIYIYIYISYGTSRKSSLGVPREPSPSFAREEFNASGYARAESLLRPRRLSRCLGFPPGQRPSALRPATSGGRACLETMINRAFDVPRLGKIRNT